MSRPDSAALAERYRSYSGSGEHAALAVLLGHEPVAAAPKFCRHASTRGIDWDAVLAETWSPAERLLVATAAGLWSGRRTPVDISRAAFLDDGQFAVWQAMLTAHRTGQAPAVTAPPEGGGRDA
jgi:hypothetical protein